MIIAVDDEKRILGLVTGEIRKAAPDCSLAGFISAREALAYARGNAVDAAFLDIDMGEMSGLELAAALREINAKTGVIFVTGYGQYIDDAFKMHCSGYIMKPVRAENVTIELARLRHNPTLLFNDQSKLPDSIGEYNIDHSLRRVYKHGNDLALKPTEYNILVRLLEDTGAFIPNDTLFEKSFGTKSIGDFNALYVQIHRLRKHLGLDDPDAGIDIERKLGKGYRLIVK